MKWSESQYVFEDMHNTVQSLMLALFQYKVKQFIQVPTLGKQNDDDALLQLS